ncbi:MAG TPA: high-affinity branched-chain amino acid transport [Firmicutes bacterium]|nr:high-affinity branched-chain amino acid transport [Bacillota bacterium]HBK61661.1 high-affinity branched-chain amino acid transport [Bacillota bacterium]
MKVSPNAYVLGNGRIALEGTGQSMLNNPHVQGVYLGV